MQISYRTKNKKFFGELNKVSLKQKSNQLKPKTKLVKNKKKKNIVLKNTYSHKTKRDQHRVLPQIRERFGTFSAARSASNKFSPQRIFKKHQKFLRYNQHPRPWWELPWLPGQEPPWWIESVWTICPTKVNFDLSINFSPIKRNYYVIA